MSKIDCLLIGLCIISLPSALDGQYDSIAFQGYQRTYLMHLPNHSSGKELLPLVIALHGGFGSAENLQKQSGLSDLADQENFAVVYPEGVDDGFLKIRTWNAGWCCGFSSMINIDDVGFINALLDTLLNKYPIDDQRVYATGMSNGGFMSYRLACELPDRIAAIAPVAASMSLSECMIENPVPVIHFHSYRDESVPYQGGVGNGVSDHYNRPLDSVAMVFSAGNNCQVKKDTVLHNSDYTHIQWRECNCNTEINQYITQDGGHSWPGGTKTVIGDPVSAEINANELMWEFFKRCSLQCNMTTNSNLTKDKVTKPFIYPNPAVSQLNIQWPAAQHGEVVIYNSMGSPVYTQPDLKPLEIAGLPSGIYFILIKNGSHQHWEKIIKN